MKKTDSSYFARLLREYQQTIAHTLDEQRAEVVARRRATQGYYHHQKIDRMIEVASKNNLPVVMYAESDDEKRAEMFERLVAELYAKGRAAEVATVLEMDAVIGPANTRDVICRALGIQRRQGEV